jgi:DNA replication protein DnaC
VNDFHDYAVGMLQGRYIDPQTVPVEPSPFDPVAHRVQNANLALDCGVPQRFRHAEVTHPQVAEWVSQYRRGCRSLMMTGAPGSGKTHHAFAALRMVVLAVAGTGGGLVWRVVTHPALTDLLRPRSDRSHEYAMEPYLDADLVLLDDLGAAKQTDWTTDCLYRLVDHRWSEQLTTIFTSNLTPAALKAAVGERVVSRVFDSTRVVLDGSDRRRRD